MEKKLETSTRLLWLMTGVYFVSSIFFTLATARVARAAVFHCPAGQVRCLIDAINTANGNDEDDTINLEAGTYTLAAVDNTVDGPNGLPSITTPITIRRIGASAPVIERDPMLGLPPFGDPLFRIFHVAPSGTLTLDGLTIRNGALEFSPGGGGLFNRGTVTISSSSIIDNFEDAGEGGGGIINFGGTVTITDSIISDNFVTDTNGGGISNRNGTAIVTNSTIANNVSFLNGGGIENTGTVVMTNSTLANNVGDFGGGMSNFFGTVDITNSTVAANSAAFGHGGGIDNFFGTVTVTNSTVADNVVDVIGGVGGGINNDMGTAELQNTILARNVILEAGESSPGDCFGAITSLGHNLIGDPTDCTLALLASDLTGDPGLGEFTDNGTPGEGYFPLLATSRAIDVGNNETCPSTDQLGQGHVDGDGDGIVICDIGAIEFQSELVVPIDISPGKSLNRINPKRRGKISVAVLATRAFDATTINQATVRFGATGVEAAPQHSTLEDIDGDGTIDMILRFNSQDTDIQCGDTSASLRGEILSGQTIRGSDSIKTVGCK